MNEVYVSNPAWRPLEKFDTVLKDDLEDGNSRFDMY